MTRDCVPDTVMSAAGKNWDEEMTRNRDLRSSKPGRAKRAVLALTVVSGLVPMLCTQPALATADGPDAFRVVGVQRGDVLWIRSGPSAGNSKVGAIPYDARGITNLGCRDFGNRIWCEVSYRGVTGWSNGRYLGED